MANPGASFDAILPPVFKPDVFEKALFNEANKFATDVKKEFDKTTRGHSHPARFTKKIVTIAGMIRVMVRTTAEYYQYIDQPTKPHRIRVRRRKAHRKVLHWTTGNGDAFATVVKHPGFKGYHHSDRIAHDMTPEFKRRMDNALIEGREKCMHAI